MTQIIDRRINGKNKSAVNRQRFINRFKKQIKEAVTKAISKRSITNINNGEKITIPSKDISEPTFSYGKGGVHDLIYPGNREFIKGDKIKKPEKSNTGTGSTASNQGEGLDEFGFELTKEEFLDLFFEDLELPNMVKTRLQETPIYQYTKAGFSTVGTPPNINIIRSFRNAISRRIIFNSQYREHLDELEKELKEAEKSSSDNVIKIVEIKEKIAQVQKKVESIPFIDEFDVRYNMRLKVPKPSTRAVMFCIMDVSGSMDEVKKEIAKRFFILLYLFLSKTYEKIEVVFIRHHTTAKEVNENDFFYSRETGGTVVSSALECMRDIIQKRYPTDDWNIYAAQASDGDNWNADSPLCQEILIKDILPYLQYFAYIEIMPRHHQSLWRSYLEIKQIYKNFAMQSINSVKEIYPVLHELFKRKMA